MRHKRIIESINATKYIGRHLTIIVQDGIMIGHGVNHRADPPIHLGYKDKRHNIHSEVSAFRKCRGILDLRRSWDVINVRFRMDGSIGNACPCYICHSFLAASGCKHVVYSNDVGTFSGYTL